MYSGLCLFWISRTVAPKSVSEAGHLLVDPQALGLKRRFARTLQAQGLRASAFGSVSETWGESKRCYGV